MANDKFPQNGQTFLNGLELILNDRNVMIKLFRPVVTQKSFSDLNILRRDSLLSILLTMDFLVKPLLDLIIRFIQNK
jgi:hypothetical protein